MKILLCFLFVLASSVSMSAAAKPVRIGFMSGLTGSDPNTARELVRGVEAFKKAKGNEIASQVQIEILDSQGSAEKTVSVMRKAYEEGIRIFVGLSSSNEAMAAAKFIAARDDALFMTPFATNPKVTQISNRVFRTCFDDHAQGEFLADFALKLKPKSIIIFENLESLYSQGLSQTFRTRLASLNPPAITPTTIKYLPSDLEDEKLVKSLENAKPDLVFIPDSAQSSAKIIKQVSAVHPNVQYLGGDGWGGNVLFHAILPKEQKLSLRYSTYWHSEIQTAYNEAFKRAYSQAADGAIPTSGAALSYEALDIVFQALAHNNFKPDVEKLRKYIGSSRFQGTTGVLQFKNEGTPKRKIVLMKLDKNLNYKPEASE